MAMAQALSLDTFLQTHINTSNKFTIKIPKLNVFWSIVVKKNFKKAFLQFSNWTKVRLKHEMLFIIHITHLYSSNWGGMVVPCAGLCGWALSGVGLLPGSGRSQPRSRDRPGTAGHISRLMQRMWIWDPPLIRSAGLLFGCFCPDLAFLARSLTSWNPCMTSQLAVSVPTVYKANGSRSPLVSARAASLHRTHLLLVWIGSWIGC